jgi:AraC-like DNA-binding protein
MRTARVCASGLADWRKVLLQHGMPPGDPLFAEGMGPNAADEKTIELAAFVRLLETVADRGGEDGIAWSVGQSARHAIGGRVGQAVLGSRTLGGGLRQLCNLVPLIQDISSLRLDVEEDWATLSYRILDPGIWPRHTEAVYSLGIYGFLVRSCAPDAWGQVEITVEAEKPLVRSRLDGIAQANVTYGGPANAIRFPAQILNRAINLAPPAAASIHAELSRELARERRTMPIADRVRQLIYDRIGEPRLCQDYVARELGVSGRTLRRKLGEDGLSYQMILDECRMRIAALEFRTRRNLSLPELALRLGYSEHSNFTRAFSRWTGLPPQDYREAVLAS